MLRVISCTLGAIQARTSRHLFLPHITITTIITIIIAIVTIITTIAISIIISITCGVMEQTCWTGTGFHVRSSAAIFALDKALSSR
jgi:uncharacterized membrane protein YdbT with pleckstrin-like domain